MCALTESSEETPKMVSQAAFVYEGKVIHGGKGLGILVTQAGNAHHELLCFETKALS